MWKATYEKTFPGLTKEQVWSAWADVNRWSEWDQELEFTKMTGEFREGTRFVLRPKGGPTVNIEISDADPNRGFTDVTRFPLAKMYDSHEMEETPEGLKISSVIRIEGPLAFFWRRIVAQGVADGVPQQMEAFVRYVTSKN